MFLRKKSIVAIILAIIVGSSGGCIYWFLRLQTHPNFLTIYGNIDIRQVEVAFYISGRIHKLFVQEGDTVHKGQLLAELDPIRFQEALAMNQGQVSSQEAVLKNAKITLTRNQILIKDHAASKQELDDSIAAHAIAYHTLEANRAALALAKQDLIDSKLYAPKSGVIQTRVLEPGDMVTPQTPVYSLALNNPVWVRAYLPEKELGKIQLGQKAWIKSDSFPGKSFPGWIGFISPTAEFTPKTVQTTELRTELVYQVRVYACNPDYKLRLGMPVTVSIPFNDIKPQACVSIYVDH